MPLIGFVCLDGHTVDLDTCYQGCRMPQRCLTLPTLRLIGYQRPWVGKPSTTQCINGTMQEFLRLTCNYTIYPEDRAFAVLGTIHHGRLEETGDDLVTEETFANAQVTGTCDLLEPVEHYTDNAGLLGEAEIGYILTDYKTWGSYRVGKFLGLTPQYIDDPEGALYQRKTQVDGQTYYPGQTKQVKLWMPNPLVADTEEVELQLNHYRLLAEASGFDIQRMQVQITVRDGGLMMAKSRGVDFRMRCFPVAFREDEEIRAYFDAKAQALTRALDQGHWDEPCTEQESWGKDRCRNYCEVARFCPQGLEVLANA